MGFNSGFKGLRTSYGCDWIYLEQDDQKRRAEMWAVVEVEAKQCAENLSTRAASISV